MFLNTGVRKMLRKPIFIVIVLAAALCFACNDNPDTEEGAVADGDMSEDDGSDGDGDAIDGDATDDESEDVTDGDDENDTELTEFQIRVPDPAALSCEDPDMGFISDWRQIDHVCSIHNAALDAEIYVQANPVECLLFDTAAYSVTNAWIQIDGEISGLSAAYDYGYRHHNDFITFQLNGRKHIIWHSSIGWGFRACYRPDCMVICDEGTDCVHGTETDVQQDGCEREAGSGPPPLPVICVEVLPDGSVPELLDPWTEHDGEPDYPRLPCLGEENYIR